MRIHRRLLPALAVLWCVPVGAEVIRLESGEWLQGDILEHTESDFQFRRWDNGGEIRLGWDALVPEDAVRIQRKLGYVTEEDIKETTRGVQIVSKEGKVYEGLLLRASPTEIEIKTPFRSVKIPVAEIRPTPDGALYREVDLPVTKVWSRKDLYVQKQAELDALNKDQKPNVQAQNHYVFSDWLSRSGYLDEAKTHLLRSFSLEPDYATRFQGRLTEIQTAIDRKEVEDRFEAARFLARERRFADAFTALDEMVIDFPPERLTRAVADERAWLQDRKDQYMLEAVEDRYFSHLRSLANAKARDRSVDFAEAVQYAGQAMGTEALTQAAEELDLEDQEATQYFGQRPRSRTRNAAFGAGTFIVGTDLDQAPAVASGGQGGGRQGGQGQGQAQTDPQEAWWASQSSSTKGSFLYAYHCLQNFEVSRSAYDACPTCGAKGVLIKLNTGVGGGSSSAAECPRCHGVRYDRSIQFK